MHLHSVSTAFTASIAILAALLAAPAARATEPSAPYTDSESRLVIVRIHRSGLRPPRIVVGRDQRVLWRNDSGSAAQVILPGRVAEGTICNDVRPTFARVAKGELASRPLHSSGIVLPCKLPPGTYRYRVVLVPGTGGILPGVTPTLNGPPLRTFRGELLVR